MAGKCLSNSCSSFCTSMWVALQLLATSYYCCSTVAKLQVAYVASVVLFVFHPLSLFLSLSLSLSLSVVFPRPAPALAQSSPCSGGALSAWVCFTTPACFCAVRVRQPATVAIGPVFNRRGLRPATAQLLHMSLPPANAIRWEKIERERGRGKKWVDEY